MSFSTSFGFALAPAIPLMLTVRWSIQASTHLTLTIPLILTIQSTVFKVARLEFLGLMPPNFEH